MIIASLKGGLGNQMFQYAMARRLSVEREVPIRLDLSWFEVPRRRAYALGAFAIVEEIVPERELRRLHPPSRIVRGVRRLVDESLPYSMRSVIRERGASFNAGVLRARGTVLVRGHWQSEKYFAPIGDLIREEFTLRAPPGPRNRAVLDQIATVNAVSLHVRRGDYASNPKTRQLLGVCTTDYYQRAVDEMARRVPDPHFFAFSDEPEWVQENLRFEHPCTIVGHNGDEPQEDLRLIAACRHHVVANSSFSWWGAWLNPSPTKIVIAPSRWINDERLEGDRVPPGWIRI